MRALLALFSLLASSIVLLAPEARADDCGVLGGVKTCTVTGGLSVSGSASSGSATGGAGTNGPAPVGATQLVACGTGTAADLTGLGDPEAGADADSCGAAVPTCKATAPGADSAAIRVQKQADGRWTLNGSVCTKPAKPVVTAEMVRDRVVRLIPTAGLGLAPHDSTLVNIQTIMWVDASRTQQLPPLTILGQGVTVSLTLDHVDWTFGDHASATTTSAGKAYDNTGDPCRTATCPDYFGHTYRTSGRQTVHATATWTARFTVASGQPQAIPGTVAGPTAAAALVVKQARSVLIPTPGQH